MCIVHGCNSPSRTNPSGWHKRPQRYCNRHHLALFRNGHPEQHAIGKGDLKPYRKMVDDHLKGPRGADVVDYLEQVWGRLRSFADATLEEAKQKPTNKWLKEACRNVLIVANEATGLDVGRQVIALWLLQEDRPEALKSDEAFRLQLARVFRILAPRELVATSWDHERGRLSRTWLRTQPIRARRALADLLVSAYAPAAAGFLGLVRAKERARMDALDKVQAAFRTMEREVYGAELKRQEAILQKCHTTPGDTDEWLGFTKRAV